MRWDRLFTELEQSRADDLRLEHEALADELRDEQWAATSWSELLGGAVEFELCSGTWIRGPVDLITDDVVATESMIVFREAIVGLRHGRREGSPRTSRLGWATAVRALVDELGPQIQITRRDGSVVAGELSVVGKDFVQVGDLVVRTSAISCVSRRP